MTVVRAVLLDVFETVLTVDFDSALDGLVEVSGVDKEQWVAGFYAARDGLLTGTVSPEDAVTAILQRAQGGAPGGCLAHRPSGDRAAAGARDALSGRGAVPG